MHFRFYRKSAKGSEEVEEEMDQLQAQIREEAYGKRLNLAKDKKKKKKEKKSHFQNSPKAFGELMSILTESVW